MAPNYRDLKISKFLLEKDDLEELTSSTGMRGNIYTLTNDATEAFLPEDSFYNIQIGSLITAHGVTRYVVSKNVEKKSVILNEPVNWKNRGKGYSFRYNNPIAHMLDNAHDIIGYVTRSGLIYLAEDSLELKVNKIISNNINGLQLLNQNGYGIYISQEGDIYQGSNNTEWTELCDCSGGTAIGDIDGGPFIQ